jgi:hypothetical protein
MVVTIVSSRTIAIMSIIITTKIDVTVLRARDGRLYCLTVHGLIVQCL